MPKIYSFEECKDYLEKKHGYTEDSFDEFLAIIDTLDPNGNTISFCKEDLELIEAIECEVCDSFIKEFADKDGYVRLSWSL